MNRERILRAAYVVTGHRAVLLYGAAVLAGLAVLASMTDWGAGDVPVSVWWLLVLLYLGLWLIVGWLHDLLRDYGE